MFGDFECRETMEDLSKYGLLSFGFDAKKADDWGNEQYKDWMKRNKNIKEDIEFYTYTGHLAIRGLLDGTGNYSQEVKKIDENLHRGLQDAALPEDIVLYRAISQIALNKMLKESGYDGNLNAGFVLRDNSYMSCSVVANNSFNTQPSKKVIFRIAAQKGQHAAYINKWSSVKNDEYEMLVDKNSYIYVSNCYYVPRKAVTGIGKDEDVVLVVEGELLQK